METVIIHGQSHQGSTCHLARLLAEQLGGNVTEFFLPRDFGCFCLGCNTCFEKSEAGCPHYEALRPITAALDRADVIILASPVYVYHATGAMKALLDHYGYRWMVHRPEAGMFTKQAVCVSTAAGAGMKRTNRDMADSAFFWGCGRIYQLGLAVRAVSWDRVSPKLRARAERRIQKLAAKIRKRRGRVKPGVKTRGFFYIMRWMNRNGWNETDRVYWRETGWLGKTRPWRA